jgi:hypothetical protein
MLAVLVIVLMAGGAGALSKYAGGGLTDYQVWVN